MGDLSPNFSRSEFVCRCGCGEDDISPKLVAALEQLRDLAGKPVNVVSGCRCPAHNRAVGGTTDSFHVPDRRRAGEAADIVIPGFSIKKMYRLAEQISAFNCGGIGLYPEAQPPFIHVDIRGYKSRWAKIGGHYVGIDQALA